jgi:hypothetical protein
LIGLEQHCFLTFLCWVAVLDDIFVFFYQAKTWTRLFAMLLLLFAITLWFAYKNKNRIWIILPVFSGVLISLSFQALLIIR